MGQRIIRSNDLISADLQHLLRLPMHHPMQSDQCLLRHETIIIKLLAGRIENGQIVVEDIGIGHTDSVSE